jgi:hypothetical protein
MSGHKLITGDTAMTAYDCHMPRHSLSLSMLVSETVYRLVLSVERLVRITAGR